MLATSTNVINNNELVLSHFFHIVEKLGVVSNELQYFINTLEYYMGISGPDVSGLAEKSDNTTSPRWKETIAMHQTSQSLISSTKQSFEILLDAYLDAVQYQSSASWLVYYSVLSCVNVKLNNVIGKMASLNHKLLQIRQSGTPKYNPTPPYVKRYQNILAHDFMSEYVNHIIRRLHKILKIPSSIPRAILLWEHTVRDSINWERLNINDSIQDNLIIMESFFALELPINLSLHIHEAMHYYLEQLIHHRHQIPDSVDFIDAYMVMRKNIIDFSTVFGMYHSHAEIEYICDYLTYLLFGENYITSLYYLLFAHDAHANLIDINNGGCDKANFTGNIPSTIPGSWWSRLKVLVDIHFNANSNISDWLKLINHQLKLYHIGLRNEFPAEFEDAILKHITVEERIASLAKDNLDALSKTTVVNKIRRVAKKLNVDGKRHFDSFKYDKLFSKQILWYIDKQWHIEIKDKYGFMAEGLFPQDTTIQDIPLVTYKKIFKMLYLEMNDALGTGYDTNKILKQESSHQDNSKLARAEELLRLVASNPVPAVRLFRYIARCWPNRSSLTSPDINKLETNLFLYKNDGTTPSKNTAETDVFWDEEENIPPLHCEVGMIKCRTDLYKPKGKINKDGQAINDIDRYNNITLCKINQSLLDFISYSDFKEPGSKEAKHDKTRIKRQAFICFGSYNIILLRPNVSAKALTSANYNNGVSNEWPPKFEFPFFVNTHPLIRLDYNKKHNKSQVEKYGVFSCMIQCKILTNKLLPRIVAEIRNIINNEHEKCNKLDWSIYTSAGWEDIVIFINFLSLKQIREIKKRIFRSVSIERTTTHILLDCDTYSKVIKNKTSDALREETLRSADADIITKLRVREHNMMDDVDLKIVKKIRDSIAYSRNAIDEVYLTPGAHDISIKWNSDLTVYDFLIHYREIRDDNIIMSAITDIETNFMWRLLTADNQN